MKHYYQIEMNFTDCTFVMPYVFESFKKACLYGEYKYRKEEDLLSYRIITLMKPDSDFYILKSR